MTPIRMAQYGTRHGHAEGKLAALRGSADVDLAGVLEPDAARRAALDRPGTAYHGVRWLTHPAEILDDPTIVAVASEGRNDESLEQTARLVRAGKHVWYDKPAGRRLDAVADGRGRGPARELAHPGRLHVPLPRGLPSDRRMGAVRAPGRRLRDPRPHVDLDPAGRPAGHRPPPRRHLLRPGRPHARSDRLDARPSRRGDGLSPAGRSDVPGFADNTLGVLAYPRALGVRRHRGDGSRRRWRAASRCTGAGAAPSWSRSSRPVRSGSAWPRPSASVRPASSASPCAPQTRQELYELELDGLRGRAPGPRGSPTGRSITSSWSRKRSCAPPVGFPRRADREPGCGRGSTRGVDFAGWAQRTRARQEPPPRPARSRSGPGRSGDPPRPRSAPRRRAGRGAARGGARVRAGRTAPTRGIARCEARRGCPVEAPPGTRGPRPRGSSRAASRTRPRDARCGSPGRSPRP